MKHLPFLAATLLFCAACRTAAPLETAGTEAIVPQYTLHLREINNTTAPALQSFAFAESNGLWLVLGGRTNGFHRTSDKESTFPVSMANHMVHVIDPVGDKAWAAELPETLLTRLRSTNQESYQDGTQLIVIGGYGATTPDSEASSYQTFPCLTVIDVPAAISAVQAQDSTALAAAMVSIDDDRMRVTGGGLLKLGEYFYLVLGQNYDKIYKGAYVGHYTEEVRRFRLSQSDGQLAITDYEVFRDPQGSGENSQYHRRDLNVCHGVRADGSLGINVLSGVFTPQASAWLNPITIDANGSGTPSIVVHTEFDQNWTNYEAGHALIFDSASGAMLTTVFGGISYYYYDDQGTPTESNIDNSNPFVKAVNTIIQAADGSFSEHVQAPADSLPTFLGANAIFVPLPAIPLVAGTTDVIDYQELDSSSEVIIGHLYGGIEATGQQSLEFNPTFASKAIFEVLLLR